MVRLHPDPPIKLSGNVPIDGRSVHISYDSTRPQQWIACVEGGELGANSSAELVALVKNWKPSRFRDEPGRDTALRVQKGDAFFIAFRSPGDGMWRTTGMPGIRDWPEMSEWIGESPCWRESGEEWFEVPTLARLRLRRCAQRAVLAEF